MNYPEPSHPVPWEEEAKRLRTLGLAVIETEAQAVLGLKKRIDGAFTEACRHLFHCQGRAVVIGMGKSGHVGSKVAATLASTGTPAFFVHPGEASHGDLGMITNRDVVLALSNSGETDEIITILPLIKRLNIPLIALTGNPKSTLARNATVHIEVSVEKEACPLGLAPTASTTAALVMGDALAVSLLEARGFTAEDFALSHPAGSLGRRLLLHIDDIMHTGEDIPMVRDDALLKDALVEVTRGGLGMTAVVDADDRAVGIYTDGDLRRTLDRGTDIHSVPISMCMTRGFTSVRPGLLASEAVSIMEQRKINALLVLDPDDRLVGALNMHDLLRAGVV